MKKIVYALSLGIFGLMASCSKEQQQVSTSPTSTHATIKALAKNYAGEQSAKHTYDEAATGADKCPRKGTDCLDPVVVHPHHPLLTGLTDAVNTRNNSTIQSFFAGNKTDLTEFFSLGRIEDVINGSLTVALYQPPTDANRNYFKFSDGSATDVVPVVAE